MTQSKVPAVIFDIDGTLADVEHRRHFVARPKRDWKSFYESCVTDRPKGWVQFLNHALNDSTPLCIILVSGRPEEYRPHTVQWLREHDIKYSHLFMRPSGNYERDDIVKEAIYWEDIQPHYAVKLVIDDRNRVVKMWRALGLECWQVADGDF